jgi:hypothetical protein
MKKGKPATRIIFPSSLLQYSERSFSFFSGPDGEEGPADMYRRERELEGEEVARKGRDEDFYPEGNDDDLMGIKTEDKDTQTGNTMMNMCTQQYVHGKDFACQTERTATPRWPMGSWTWPRVRTPTSAEARGG